MIIRYPFLHFASVLLLKCYKDKGLKKDRLFTPILVWVLLGMSDAGQRNKMRREPALRQAPFWVLLLFIKRRK
jgi:hypothetical protein